MSSISSILAALLIFGTSPLLILYLSRFVARLTVKGPINVKSPTTSKDPTTAPAYLTWLTPLALIAWFLAANLVGYFSRDSTRGFATTARTPMLVIPMLVAVLTVLLSKPAARVLKAMPPDWLINIQVYRIDGFLFLFLYVHQGFVARNFAYSAGFGDIFVGLSSIFIARWVRARSSGYLTAAVIWNIIGITDLVLAPISAGITGFKGITSFPLVLVPLFMGPPLGIAMHIASLKNLYLLSRSFRRQTLPPIRVSPAN